MTKNNLISLIILDVIVMAMAIGLMAYRYQAVANLPVSALKQNMSTESETAKPAPQVQPPAPEDTSALSEEADAQEEKLAPEAGAKPRNICFTYNNSKAKRVEVIGDFTKWVPKKMTKGAGGTWKVTLALAPGDYAYNFVINGKPKRDPNNPKVCDAGRGFPNSFLKVKPLSNDNK